MRTIREYFRIKLHWFRIYLRAIKNLWKLGSMDKGLKDYYKYKHIINNRLDELEERVDNNYDKLEDKIEEEGKLFDSLEAMQGVNRNSIETLSRGLIDLEQRTKASLNEVSLIIDEMDKHINLTKKVGK